MESTTKIGTIIQETTRKLLDWLIIRDFQALSNYACHMHKILNKNNV